MDYDFYLKKFEKSAAQLDKNLFKEKQLEISVGIVLNSVFLKLYKKSWVNENEKEMNAKTKVFFSIWVNEKAIKESKIFYNIHALKLRQLKGYSIRSRDFAENFRKDFKKFQQNWENVSLNFGPLTLMEGWNKLDIKNVENIIVSLAKKFLAIDYLVDKTLRRFEN